jgi:hypothetical protein
MFLIALTGDMDKKALVFETKRELKNGNHVAFIAFTGWGKTYLASQVAIELAKEGSRVGMFFPTNTLALKKWKEFTMLLENANPRPSAILTAGAQQFCVYKWRYPQRQCSRCALYKRNARIEAPSLLTYLDLDKLVPEDMCTYWAQEELFPKYDIVIGHYGRAPKILPHVNFAVWDEAQELFIPNIRTTTLSEIAEVLKVDVAELTSPDVIKDYAESRLINADSTREDAIFSLLQMLNNTCWIEDGTLNCLDLRQVPSNVPSLMLTATPPPGWPPEGWGRKIEIKPPAKPRAFIEPEAKFYYKDNYNGIGLQTYLTIQWLRKKFGARCIIIFAISSVKRVLEYTLPIEVSHEPPENESQIPPSGVVVVDAWGRMRVGVDIAWCDAAVLPWPSLHIAARRRLWAEGKNPDVAELIVAVQNAGRVMRPRPYETYKKALERRIVVMIDGRFAKHIEYLSQFYRVEELPADIHKQA